MAEASDFLQRDGVIVRCVNIRRLSLWRDLAAAIIVFTFQVFRRRCFQADSDPARLKGIRRLFFDPISLPITLRVGSDAI